MKPLIYAFVGILVIAVVAVVAADSGDEAPSSPLATSVPHYQASTLRRVEVTADAQLSRGQDPMWVELIDGAIPDDVTRLTVLTDENCVPDADGVSHCLNRVRFATAGGTGEAVLQHHHRMAEEPCLAPGETVVLTT
jgi:hypothetical protein